MSHVCVNLIYKNRQIKVTFNIQIFSLIVQEFLELVDGKLLAFRVLNSFYN